uniref:Uncharacterized protein n=1 Tax=Candidatus Kentrum sp. TC TaxID=2126339 RepID=A0A450Z5T4_9GAMM|nr:MAG: hypothetical protein BECKTC1821D_GA0114238_107011 [Candidatus Kentron sp. TC]
MYAIRILFEVEKQELKKTNAMITAKDGSSHWEWSIRHLFHIRTASLEELCAMKERGELATTRANAETVDMPDGFWDGAKLLAPIKKKQPLRVDLFEEPYFP